MLSTVAPYTEGNSETAEDGPLFSQGFYIFAVTFCFITSFLGTVCNIFLLIKFVKLNEKSNGFQKICLVKTIPNIIVCCSFLFWVVPLTIFRYTYDDVSYWLNSIIGVMAGTWAYVLSSILQVSMSCNRFYVLYFPRGLKSMKRIPMTYVAIGFALIAVSIYAVISIPKGCRYVFDPGYFQWRPEDDECAANINEIVMFAILTDTVISNTFNVGTAVRLVMSKVSGMSQQDSSRRRKRWMIMFVQGVLQDCLHIVDILTSRYLYKLSDELWFQFLCLTLSFILIYTGRISSVGLVCNFYFTIKSIFRKPHSNGFQRICTVKTMNNCIICSTFLFWVLPVTLFQFTYSELNYPANRIISGMAALWAYVLNSLLQVCLACNRFYGLYFPLGIAIWKTVPMANMAIAISVTLTSMLSFVSIPVGCGYIYDPNLFVWRTEFHDCSKRLAVIFPFVILGTTIATNAFNVAIGTRLLAMKLIGVKEEEAKERRRRWMVMFIQCVLQDCLQLFDTINSYYIVLLSEKVWFQFLFVTLSLVFIATMDGVVMLACNSDIHPEFVKNWKIKKKQRRNTLVLVTTSGHSIH